MKCNDCGKEKGLAQWTRGSLPGIEIPYYEGPGICTSCRDIRFEQAFLESKFVEKRTEYTLKLERRIMELELAIKAISPWLPNIRVEDFILNEYTRACDLIFKANDAIFCRKLEEDR